MNDVNLPKFTSNDLPLFKGITSDLFPGITLPKPDYGGLEKYLRVACRELNLQDSETFMLKCIQLYSTVMVRHGLMMVGETMSGKTKSIKVLAMAMSKCKQEEISGFELVDMHIMNPKSVFQRQLYGAFDENTHEWTDGILAVTVRDCAKSTTANRKWCIFDGPVDAVWIENMNTVLDDNKKLCLNSGEQIKLSSTMTMMFEVEDLSVASPATISRCGMVYLEPGPLGWRPLVKSWIVRTCAKLFPGTEDDEKEENSGLKKTRAAKAEFIEGIFEWILPSIEPIMKKMRTIIKVSFVELVFNLVNLFECSLMESPGAYVGKKGDDNLEAAFVFCIYLDLWSCCRRRLPHAVIGPLTKNNHG